MDKLNFSYSDKIKLFFLSFTGCLIVPVFFYTKTKNLDKESCFRVGTIWFFATIFFFLITQLDKGKFMYSKQTDYFKSKISPEFFWASSVISVVASAIVFLMF